MGYFLPFNLSNSSRNQNFTKMKKTSGDIIILHMCIINYHQVMYSSWYMVHDRWTKFQMDRWTKFLSMDKVSVSYIFFFSRYQTRCVIKFLLKQLMTSDYNFKIYLQSTSKATTGKGKKRGRWKYKNLNISWPKIPF